MDPKSTPIQVFRAAGPHNRAGPATVGTGSRMHMPEDKLLKVILTMLARHGQGKITTIRYTKDRKQLLLEPDCWRLLHLKSKSVRELIHMFVEIGIKRTEAPSQKGKRRSSTTFSKVLEMYEPCFGPLSVPGFYEDGMHWAIIETSASMVSWSTRSHACDDHRDEEPKHTCTDRSQDIEFGDLHHNCWFCLPGTPLKECQYSRQPMPYKVFDWSCAVCLQDQAAEMTNYAYYLGHHDAADMSLVTAPVQMTWEPHGPLNNPQRMVPWVVDLFTGCEAIASLITEGLASPCNVLDYIGAWCDLPEEYLSPPKIPSQGLSAVSEGKWSEATAEFCTPMKTPAVGANDEHHTSPDPWNPLHLTSRTRNTARDVERPEVMIFENLGVAADKNFHPSFDQYDPLQNPSRALDPFWNQSWPGTLAQIFAPTACPIIASNDEGYGSFGSRHTTCADPPLVCTCAGLLHPLSAS